MDRGYYTQEHRKNEGRIAAIYEQLNPGLRVVHLGGYTRYDCVAFEGQTTTKNCFIEIKKRNGAFPKWEFFSQPKLDFTRKCGHQCYFICERDIYAQIYDMTEIVKKYDDGSRAIFLTEIVRKDRPIDAQTWEVIKFPSEWGKIIYYL